MLRSFQTTFLGLCLSACGGDYFSSGIDANKTLGALSESELELLCERYDRAQWQFARDKKDGICRIRVAQGGDSASCQRAFDECVEQQEKVEFVRGTCTRRRKCISEVTISAYEACINARLNASGALYNYIGGASCEETNQKLSSMDQAVVNSSKEPAECDAIYQGC